MNQPGLRGRHTTTQRYYPLVYMCGEKGQNLISLSWWFDFHKCKLFMLLININHHNVIIYSLVNKHAFSPLKSHLTIFVFVCRLS